jgi:hypothetical protein
MGTINISWGGGRGGGLGDRCLRMIRLPPSCADCLEIWEPQTLFQVRTGIALPVVLPFFFRWYYWVGSLVLRLIDNTQIDTHPAGLLRASNRLVAEAATCKTHTNTTDIHALSKFRNRNTSNHVAADLRLRPYNHRHRPLIYDAVTDTTTILFKSKKLTMTFLLVVYIYWMPSRNPVWQLYRIFSIILKYMPTFRHHTSLNYIYYIYIYLFIYKFWIALESYKY